MLRTRLALLAHLSSCGRARVILSEGERANTARVILSEGERITARVILSEGEQATTSGTTTTSPREPESKDPPRSPNPSP